MNFGMADDGAPAPIYMDTDDYAVLSDEAKHDIDVKTQSLLTNAYTRAAKYLKDHEKELHDLAEALIEFETLSADEIKLAISGKRGLIHAGRQQDTSEGGSLDSGKEAEKNEVPLSGAKVGPNASPLVQKAEGQS